MPGNLGNFLGSRCFARRPALLVLVAGCGDGRSQLRWRGGAAIRGPCICDTEGVLFRGVQRLVLGAEGTFGEGVSAKTQLEFFESGRNLYLALSPSSIGNARALAGRLGADLEARPSLVRALLFR